MEGERTSVWMATTEPTAYAPLTGDLDTEVVVLGAGMTGLQTALLLAREGVRVAVLERARLAEGVSGFTTAKITALHGLVYQQLEEKLGAEAAAVYAQANSEGLRALVQTIGELGIDADLVECPAYTYAETAEQRAAVEREAQAAARAGLAATFVEQAPLPFPTYGAVTVPGQARFHPRRCLIALAAAFVAQGGLLCEHTVATGWDADEPATVSTDRGTVRAEHLVMATNSPVFDKGPYSTRMWPKSSYALAVGLGDGAPADGLFLSAGPESHSLRLQPHGDGHLLIVGGEPHKTGQTDDTAAMYEALERWAREQLDVAQVRYSWSTRDQMPVDQVPFIGAYKRGEPRALVATGFKAWGMTHSMVAALMIRRAILGEPDPWASLYDPQRSAVATSAPSFVKQNLNVARKLVGGKITMRENPTCTHMGCQTAWNEGDRTWDCPCHGSRFAEDGEVILGPAIEAASVD